MLFICASVCYRKALSILAKPLQVSLAVLQQLLNLHVFENAQEVSNMVDASGCQQ